MALYKIDAVIQTKASALESRDSCSKKSWKRLVNFGDTAFGTRLETVQPRGVLPIFFDASRRKCLRWNSSGKFFAPEVATPVARRPDAAPNCVRNATVKGYNLR